MKLFTVSPVIYKAWDRDYLGEDLYILAIDEADARNIYTKKLGLRKNKALSITEITEFEQLEPIFDYCNQNIIQKGRL